ncbi:lysylphosphatidylglycerol synthase domain-containing protein [Aurantimonas coralicida]|uniref:lysylphosphatidylglycerol synthase domain-containing protein n=1 Tax=Aurantimonas coralicida TaxID=182270 RepID=UPI001D195DBA|nr:lysylphosphatidylglycerol synthase domain-containing protein [Aurantimonas coralicida]MCC4297877.1 lysylphosphatidylglycerol synthase domain-containing protein [Aurantimonas coralicida]
MDADAKGRWLTWLRRIGIASFVALAGYLIWRTLRDYSLAELMQALRAFPLDHLALSGMFAAGSYATLTLFDLLGTRYVGHRLAYPKVALASFVSLSLGHSIGFAGLSSGAIRYRFYRRWGLSTGDVAKLILFSGLTVTVGLATLGALAVLLRPALAAEVTGLGQGMILAIGAVAALGVVIYLLLAAFLRRPLRFRSFVLEMPSLRLALGQVVLGATNFALVAACLHQALLGIAEVPYLSAATVYVLANAGVMLTHVPGGLGVFEAVVVTLLSGRGLLTAVLVFRFTYFLVPLALGGLVLAVTETVWRSKTSSGASVRSS